ncbi:MULTISPECIES: response regulator [Natrinema]|uniref:Response regulator receiver n=1 Tax=Natrinema gari JCM 14663 TaxID=1230459 RepID=L9ZBR3_9EURY|nr:MULTISPECIES: response regulator [Natrinema]AFO56134.1 response regulator receiver [Natrinema sp. J7-2]ELY83849.1 response regulator receiver [Natrinema gari JCM 14663]
MPPSLSTGPGSLLLVEDNPGDVRLIEEAFKSAGFDTTFHAIPDGDAALEFLQERAATASGPDIDLVLLDLNLPGTDGFEVLETIRDDPNLASLPVLVLSSSAATEDIVRSYELAANAYLTKPTDPSEFADIWRAVEAFWFDEATLPPVPS